MSAKSKEVWRAQTFGSRDIEVVSALIFGGRRYRHREVVKLLPLDIATVRYQVSLDFTIPVLGGNTEPVQSVFVPMRLLRKHILDDVDLRDESGSAIPALNLLDEPELTTEAIKLYWSTTLLGDESQTGQAIEDVDDVWARIKRLISTENPETADELLKEVLEWPHFLCGVSTGSRSSLEALLGQLRTQTYLYAVLSRPTPGDRRILKLAYTSSFPDEDLHRPDASDRVRDRMRDLAATLGMAATPIYYPFPALSADSIHVEVLAPPGLAFIDGYLAAGDGQNRVLLPRTPVGAALSHVYADAGDDRAGSLLAETFLMPEPSGWQKTSALTASAVAVGMLFIALNLRGLQRLETAPTAAGMFMAAGAIAVVFLAQSISNRLTRRLLRGARTLLFVNALSAGAMVLLLLLTPTHTTVDTSCGAAAKPAGSDPSVERPSTLTCNVQEAGPLERWRWPLAIVGMGSAGLAWSGPWLWFAEARRRKSSPSGLSESRPAADKEV